LKKDGVGRNTRFALTAAMDMYLEMEMDFWMEKAK